MFSVGFSKMDENEQTEIEVQIWARKRGDGPLSPELKRGEEGCPKIARGFDLKILERLLEVHTIHVHKILNPDLFVVFKPKTIDVSSCSLERVVIRGRPSAYYDGFFDKYPEPPPHPEMQEAIVAAGEWPKTSPGSYGSEIALLARAQREGRVLLRGHSTLPSDVRTAGGEIIRVASYQASVAKKHKADLKTFWSMQEQGFTTSCLWSVTFPKTSRAIEFMYLWRAVRFVRCMASSLDISTSWIGGMRTDGQGDPVEICWQAEDEYKRDVFSVSFHY